MRLCMPIVIIDSEKKKVGELFLYGIIIHIEVDAISRWS